MKKLFLSLAVLCGAAVAQAQVISGYEFKATAGTYTEITDGTVMTTEGLDGLDENEDSRFRYKAWYPDAIASESTTLPGFPIGFDFEFNDKMMNQFAISTSGFIALGKDEVTINHFDRQGFILSDDYYEIDDEVNVIGIACKDEQILIESTEVSYKLEGEAPNRVLVVQFKDLPVAFDWSGNYLGAYSAQIKLYETTNRVEIVLGTMWAPESYADGTRDVRIGMRGTGNDRLLLERPDWDNEYTLDQYVALRGGTGSVSVGPQKWMEGLTYSFDIPAPCATPEPGLFLIDDLVAESYKFSMEWALGEGVDHTLILLADSWELTQEPEAGKIYAVDSELGNAKVLAYTTDTVYEPGEWELQLEANTQYYLHIYTASTYCTGGPLYDVGTLIPLRTMPQGPASLNVTSTTLNSLTFDVESNGEQDVLVILSDSLFLNPPYAAERIFGTPDGELAVGDIVDGIGRVVYVGPSAQNVLVEGLEAGKSYYLRAHSLEVIGESYNYSSEVVDAADVTVAALPWSMNLSAVDNGIIPDGWSSTENGWVTYSRASALGGDESTQLRMTVTPNTETGVVGELEMPQLYIDKRDALLSFDCAFIEQGGMSFRPTYTAYTEWAANDKFLVQVSANGGEYETVLNYTAQSHKKPVQKEDQTYEYFMAINVDLSDYMGDVVRVRIHWECFHSTKTLCIFEDFKADGREIPAVPEVELGDVTWNSAALTWRGGQESYEVAYAVEGEEFTTVTVDTKSVVLTELTHLTRYVVKVRGIVAENDYTDWSTEVKFTTADLPACPLPTGLTHEETADYGDKLTWELNEEHLSWDLRYRESSVQSWTEVEGLNTNEYSLYNLVPGASYLWRVRAHCDMNRVSNYASQQTFTANQYTAISAATANSFNVVALKGAINVYNNGAVIESITLVDMNGRVLNNVEINSDDNVYIPVNVNGVVIVRVNTADNQFVYKVSVK